MYIPERYIRHIWKNVYLTLSALKTVDGRTLTILSPGKLNAHQGPDFHQAKICLDGQEKHGSVEIHVHTSDWKKHHHDQMPHYNEVMLHVVFEHDGQCQESPPIFELKSHLNAPLTEIIAQCIRDEAALTKSPAIACATLVSEIDDTLKLEWISTLATQRLHRKAGHGILHDLNQAMYQRLARALGYSENTAPMEALAEKVSLEELTSYASLPFGERRKTLEAIYFGLSGLLGDAEHDPYQEELMKRFNDTPFTHKVPLTKADWVFFRLRPMNFPTRRVAGLAELMSRYLERGILEHAESIMEMAVPERRKINLLLSLFLADAEGYWLTHFRFGKEGKQVPHQLIGKTRAAEIVLNSLLPMLEGLYRKKEKPVDPLHSLYLNFPKPLTNTRAEETVRILLGDAYTIRSASFEQGVLELRGTYCDAFRCLECAIGKAIFSRHIAERKD